MSAMRGMPMPGGWTMSMMWMRMPGQTWIQASASFTAMWVVMMAAMMLPSLSLMLWRYRQAVGLAGESSLGRLATIAGLGYFFAWTLFGLAVFPLGVLLARFEMQQPVLARAAPVAAAGVVFLAGLVQFTSWKTRHLDRCRRMPAHGSLVTAEAKVAWREGMRFGFDCGLSCANLTAILLVVGVMDLRAMALVTAAITAERVWPGGERVAQVFGGFIISAGLLLIARTTGLA
jgi:predicted metal-binding membrane protein